MTENKKFQKPECWEDDERMNALFQPFRTKQINPHQYETKLIFWQELIYKYCKYKKGDPTFSRKEIQLEFKRKERLAFCLETVIEEMFNQKIIKRKDELLSNPHNTWTAWAINSFVKSPARWGFNKFLGKTDLNSEELKFCHAPLLEEISDELLQILIGHPGKVLKPEDVLEISKSKLVLNEMGLNICLFNLYQQNKILIEFEIIQNDIHVNLVKIPGKDGTKQKFTDEDKSMINLKETRNVLLNQIVKMEEEISSYQELARKCVAEKNQRMAKIHLKRKLIIQNQCDKKSNILHNVETLITNMEDTQSNGEILNAYKMGSASLKSLMSNAGLSLENVDEIMSTMKEITEDHEEIQNTISSLDNTASYDDDSLENELKEILGEESISEQKRANKENLQDDLIKILENLEVNSATPNTSIDCLDKMLKG